MFRLILPTTMAATLVLAACSDSAIGPDPDEPVLEPSIQIQEEALDLYAIGEESVLTVVLEDGAVGPLTWTSAAPDVALVSGEGTVTAVANGVARIEVVTAGGERDAIDVTVDASSWIAVSAGEDFACGLAADGRAFCWGDNSSGQVGNGSEQWDIPEPTPVSGDLRFSMIDSGEDHSCGLTLDGEVHCWGQNRLGELGLGDDRQESRVPELVAGELTFTRVSAGFLSSCALDAHGQAYCWGDNRGGQLGDGTLEERRAPVPVAGSLRFLEIDVGAFHTCALVADGAAHCWGANLVGALGTGTTSSSTTPVAVQGGRSFTALSVGLDHSCAVETDGDVYCWGLNDGLQLGSATGECNPELSFACSASPLRVPLEAAMEGVSVGGFTPAFACAPSDDGTWCWGAELEAPIAIVPEGTDFDLVASGLEESYGIDAEGRLFGWDGGALASGSGVVFEQVPDREVVEASASSRVAAPPPKAR